MSSTVPPITHYAYIIAYNMAVSAESMAAPSTMEYNLYPSERKKNQSSAWGDADICNSFFY